MLGGLTKSLGLDSFFGNDRSRPTMSAEQLGFNQEDYDALKERREGYTSKFEGPEGYAERAAALGSQYGGFLDQALGAAGDDGTRSGGLYDEYLGTVDPVTGQRVGGVRGDYSALRGQAGDRDFLMQDQGFYQGLAEAQRAGQDRANQEMLRRSLSNESGGDRSGMLTRFRSMTDPLGEQRAGDALQAANMSMQNRQGMLGQQGQFLGQEGSMLDRGANMLNQGANFLSGQSSMLGQEAGYGSFGYQDALNQMKTMEDARLAALNMQFQGDMADYNKPTDFDRTMGFIGGVGSLAAGAGTLGTGAGGLMKLFS
tara:strand:+ start:507 stop:1445 length:939 start_codon:yes stop_codon:yes gene_type:complete